MRTTRLVLAGCMAVALTSASAWFAEAGAADRVARRKPSPQEALVELGRRLFMDPSASRLGRNSCASCHDPERGFSDPRAVSADDAGPTRRHSQSLIDLAGTSFHWDGEFDSVRELVVARVAPADEATKAAQARVKRRVVAARRERGERNLEFAVPQFYYGDSPPGPVTPSADRLAEDGRYADAFTAAFGAPQPTTDRIVDAIDAYCATVRSTTNAFDRYRAGDASALGESARRGLALFEGRAGCATCHVSTAPDGRAAFTDGKFHDTGVSTRAATLASAPADGGPRARPDLGLQETTFLGRNGRRFKTPTLRDIASHPPYMHDAGFATLADVVRYYSAGGTPHDGLDPAVRRLDLTEAEVADVVAFLESLSGSTRAGLGFSSPDVSPLRVRVVGIDGEPIPGLRFAVAPFGDRLLTDATEPAALEATTGDDGVAFVLRPRTTHLVLTSTAYCLDRGRPIPDSCSSCTLVAVPRGKIAVRVKRAPSHPGFPGELQIRDDRTWPRSDRSLVAVLYRAKSFGRDDVLYVGDGPAESKSGTYSLCVGTNSFPVSIPAEGGMLETVWYRE